MPACTVYAVCVLCNCTMHACACAHYTSAAAPCGDDSTRADKSSL